MLNEMTITMTLTHRGGRILHGLNIHSFLYRWAAFCQSYKLGIIELDDAGHPPPFCHYKLISRGLIHLQTGELAEIIRSYSLRLR